MKYEICARHNHKTNGQGQKSFMLVAIHFHYMVECERMIFFLNFSFCGRKKKQGHTASEQHQGVIIILFFLHT